MYYAVSACLAGFRCRYDGKYQGNPLIEYLFSKGYVLPVCPEVLGGMTIPRTPCEQIGGKVMDKNGHDYTNHFLIGAARAVILVKQAGCHAAILKSRSPSCGVDYVYDGSFTKKLIQGDGIFATLLQQNSIPLYTEESFLSVSNNERYGKIFAKVFCCNL